MTRKRILIMGAAGRDFHNFNVCYRDDASVEVVGFTATQIPNIEGRRYPAELAGKLYPEGIPDLSRIRTRSADPREIHRRGGVRVQRRFARVRHAPGLHGHGRGSVLHLLGADKTMIKSKVPVVAVCAVRTGSGKSQTTRRVSEILRAKGRKVVAVRHPMPYGDLAAQKVQRFATYEDLKKNKCTIEEMEEYEPHIMMGNIVYAGVDYGEILRQAEKEADVVLWDGGNNDTPFYKPDLLITVADPHRPGHELAYYPGEVNFRTADVIVINKMETAGREGIRDRPAEHPCGESEARSSSRRHPRCPWTSRS